MVVKVFVFGCPGSGKSTAARMMISAVPEQEKEWAVFHISDYGLLQDWFKLNSEPEKFRPSEHGGFEVRDKSIYNRAVVNVKYMILDAEEQLTKKQIIVIEFARDDYRESLRLLGKDFIQDAYFLLIDAEVDTCRQRILVRKDDPVTIHDHFVPDNVLERYRAQEGSEYAKSTFSCLKENYGVDDHHCVLVHNSSGYSKEDLNDQITGFISTIIKGPQSENEQFSDSHVPLPTQIVGYEYRDDLMPFKFAFSPT